MNQKEAETMSFQLLDNSPIAAFTFQYDAKQNMCINSWLIALYEHP